MSVCVQIWHLFHIKSKVSTLISACLILIDERFTDKTIRARWWIQFCQRYIEASDCWSINDSLILDVHRIKKMHSLLFKLKK